ncbi:hypothetical protein U1Q18_010326 [Sarracenia purpurea var. burkii]
MSVQLDPVTLGDHVKCWNCKKMGHNRRTYQRAPTRGTIRNRHGSRLSSSGPTSSMGHDSVGHSCVGTNGHALRPGCGLLLVRF